MSNSRRFSHNSTVKETGTYPGYDTKLPAQKLARKHDATMIEYAIQLAENNKVYPKWRLAAVITKGGSIISKGLSKRTNNPAYVPQGLKCSEHAEIAALKRARKSNLSGATIYVARIGRNGSPRLAKPCSICEKELAKQGVSKVVFTTNEGVQKEKLVA